MSTLNVSNITDGTDTVGTSYVVNGSAKAWVRYNHTSNTVVSSLNVSSVVDNGVGLHTVNFSSSFTGDDASGTGSNDAFQCISEIELTTSSYYRWYTRRNDGGVLDSPVSNSQYMGDLA